MLEAKQVIKNKNEAEGQTNQDHSNRERGKQTCCGDVQRKEYEEARGNQRGKETNKKHILTSLTRRQAVKTWKHKVGEG